MASVLQSYHIHGPNHSSQPLPRQGILDSADLPLRSRLLASKRLIPQPPHIVHLRHRRKEMRQYHQRAGPPHRQQLDVLGRYQQRERLDAPRDGVDGLAVAYAALDAADVAEGLLVGLARLAVGPVVAAGRQVLRQQALEVDTVLRAEVGVVAAEVRVGVGGVHEGRVVGLLGEGQDGLDALPDHDACAAADLEPVHWRLVGDEAALLEHREGGDGDEQGAEAYDLGGLDGQGCDLFSLGVEGGYEVALAGGVYLFVVGI